NGTAYVTVGQTTMNGATITVNNHRIVQIPDGGTASVVAGSTFGFAGDGGPAAAARINISPTNLSTSTNAADQVAQTVKILARDVGSNVGSNGEIIFTDSNNNRIRRISPSQTTCVKTGTIKIQGDNPVPSITSLNPTSANQGDGQFMLGVTGTGFIP